MTTLNIDFTTLFLFSIIVSCLAGLVYGIGSLVVMLVGINIVSLLIVLVAVAGSVMVLVHMVKHY